MVEGNHETTKHVIKTQDPCGYGSLGFHNTKKADVVNTRLMRRAKPKASEWNQLALSAWWIGRIEARTVGAVVVTIVLSRWIPRLVTAS